MFTSFLNRFFLVGMAEDLTRLWENLSLTEEECIDLVAQDQDLEAAKQYGHSCLVGKLFDDRAVSKETIRTKLSKGWKPAGTLTFKVLGENFFLVEFGHAADKERVLEGRPWVFEGSLFLVEDYDGSTTPAQIPFEKTAFWIRMHNLPLDCMSLAIGRQIGNTVGQVEVVDVDEKGMGWGEFLRVKIKIDLSKPLPRGRVLKVREAPRWIAFKYEKLPKYCYQCGLIKHGVTGCAKRGSYRAQEAVTEYGPWLRAPSPTRRFGGRCEVPPEKQEPKFNRSEGRWRREEYRSRSPIERRRERRSPESGGDGYETAASMDGLPRARDPWPRRSPTDFTSIPVGKESGAKEFNWGSADHTEARSHYHSADSREEMANGANQGDPGRYKG